MPDSVEQSQIFINQNDFFRDLKEIIYLLENWLHTPNDLVQIEVWIESAEKIVDSYDFNDKENSYIDSILEIYEKQFKDLIILKQGLAKEGLELIQGEITHISQEFIDGLVNRKQIEQRTHEWYEHMTQILSASELGKLFASPRVRAQLVVSKTQPYIPRQNSLAVPSSSMSAFDWGIRFEPVVKQIYEYKYNVEVRDLGRLTHPTDPRCSASPDGLVYKCNSQNNIDRKGRLIEIKCPVTREIDGQVPKDYYAQMQMQLQVTGCKQCDYIEAQFASQYNNNQIKEGPGLYNGYIALIRYANPTYEKEFYYIYSQINQSTNWIPDMDNIEDEIIEIIPWSLLQWSEQVVERNEDWWKGIQPAINNFWEDVEKTKRGEFHIPESTRIKKQKEDKCAIIFNRLDENGIPC
jgi:putative phage-type endonuclease